MVAGERLGVQAQALQIFRVARAFDHDPAPRRPARQADRLCWQRLVVRVRSLELERGRRLLALAEHRVEQHAVEALRLLRPQVHAKGTDYTPEGVPEARVDRELSIEVAICGDAKTRSSTALVERLRSSGGARRA